MNITVYLGANEGNDTSFRQAVEELGRWIGESGNALVYGGSKSGLMGALAASALSSARFSYQREQSVTAQNSGTVSALCVKEGAQVSADTALIQLSGDNLTKQVLNASDNLRSAELSVEDTQKQVDDYTITAPISGTIISKDVKVGDTVGTSTGKQA